MSLLSTKGWITSRLENHAIYINSCGYFHIGLAQIGEGEALILNSLEKPNYFQNNKMHSNCTVH